MFGEQDFDVLDEVNIGLGTQLRLVQTSGGSKRIELWSPLSKQWNAMYRYGVEDAWDGWKRLASDLDSRKKKKKTRKPRKKKT